MDDTRELDPDESEDEKTTGRSAWRAEVQARIEELRSRLAVARKPDSVPPEQQAANPRGAARCDKPDGATRAEIALRVEDELTRAETAAASKGTIRAWWTGSEITEAWEAAHNAELTLLQIECDPAIRATLPRLLAWIQRTMDAGDLRKRHEEALKTAMDAKPDPAREGQPAATTGNVDVTAVRGALTDVIAANSGRYASVRTFRNNLILVTGLLIAMLVTISVWHAFNTDFISLCANEENGKSPTGCLGGADSSPGAADVALVLLMGALGGLLAIAISFSEADVASRYDPRTWQAFLKPVTGAATALVAVLLLQAEFLLKPARETQAVFLAYAVVFGFSQQLLTRFVDKRADSLIAPDETKA